MRIGTVLSTPVELGVLQGSIISVTLFSMAINYIALSFPDGVFKSMYSILTTWRSGLLFLACLL